MVFHGAVVASASRGPASLQQASRGLAWRPPNLGSLQRQTRRHESHACYVSRDLDTPLGRRNPSGVIRLEQALARAYIYALARSLRGTSISDRLRHIFSW